MKLMRSLWNKWKKTAYMIGIFQSRMLLTIFYFVFLLPVGLITVHMLDLLQIKKSKSTWHLYNNRDAFIQLQDQA